MRKIVFVICLCFLVLTGCGSEVKISTDPFEAKADTDEGVVMEVMEGTAKAGSVSISILNTLDAEINSGNAYDFGIQVEKDGKWYPLEELDDFANTSEALIYPKDSPIEQELSWSRRYGNLPAGHYRVIKWFSEFNPKGPPHRQFALTAEFTLD